MAIRAEDVWRHDEIILHQSQGAHNDTPGTPDLVEHGKEPGIGPLVYFGETAYSFTLQEYNPELRGLQGIRMYDRMRKADAQVAASLKLVKSPVLTAQWHMEPASDDPLHVEQRDLAWWAFNNLNRPRISFMHEAMAFLDFGIYMFEKTFEYVDWTPPVTSDRKRPRSRQIVKWRDLVPRHPARIQGFKQDNGEITGIMYGNSGKFIPWDKLLVFILDQEGDEPWGRSVLRPAYQDWTYKEAMYKIDAIQKERHGIGIPNIELQPGFTNDDKIVANNLGRNLRVNEKAHVVTTPTIKVSFLKPEGQMVNVLDSARHHGLMILQNVLTQFLSLGTEESGSRAVGNTQSDAFSESIRYVVDFMAGVINQQAVEELVDFNYLNVDEYPKLRARRLGDDTRLRTMSTGIKNLVECGALTPDSEFEVWLRESLDMPRAPKEVLSRSIDKRIHPTPQGVSERIQDPNAPVPATKPAAPVKKDGVVT